MTGPPSGSRLAIGYSTSSDLYFQLAIEHGRQIQCRRAPSATSSRCCEGTNLRTLLPRKCFRWSLRVTNETCRDLVEEEGLLFKPLSENYYNDLANKVIEDNPEVVKDIQEKGKHGKIAFLIGQMMRQGEKGRMQPEVAEATLKRLLFSGEQRPDESRSILMLVPPHKSCHGLTPCLGIKSPP